MILDDSEEQLIRFLDKLNQCLETIQFIYSYSKTDTCTIVLKLEKNDAGTLKTSVYEKDINVHHCIQFFSCHPLSCNRGILFSQAKRYRRIISNDDYFKQNLEKNKQTKKKKKKKKNLRLISKCVTTLLIFYLRPFKKHHF